MRSHEERVLSPAICKRRTTKLLRKMMEQTVPFLIHRYGLWPSEKQQWVLGLQPYRGTGP